MNRGASPWEAVSMGCHARRATRVVGHRQLMFAYIALWCLFLKLETTTCGSMNSRFDTYNDFLTAKGHSIDAERTLLVEFEC